ncbi:MAG: hypothetical protein WC517_04605, partial [Patescibacteria group bacterium]
MLLSEAKSGMLGEYSTAQLSAQAASRALSSEISLLGGERLELIGDAAPSAGGTSLMVGSGYAGIYSGYLGAKEDFSRAQSLLSSSQASFSSKGADNWLSGAISEAQSSSETSQAALASLRLVRSNAEAAALSQKGASEAAIADALNATGASASSFASAQSLASARSQLAQAQDSFASAGSLPSLGARYQAYANAEAERALSEYSSLLSSARADGLDVAYEQETVSEYLSILSSSPSDDLIYAVQSSVENDRRALLLRIYEAYSYLEEKYARASGLSGEMRGFAPALSQELSPLARYFPSGTLNAGAAAGRLKQAERSLDSILQSCMQQAPQYLSFALSQNARVSELYGMPVLGRQTDYTALITTGNPSSLFASSPVSFSVRTAVPIYSSDFSGGDAISDAYPANGKTMLALSGVSPLQPFSFSFSKKDQPAQIISSEDECLFATEELASASRTISFVSSRALPTLLISQSAPPLSRSASASYAGQGFPLFSLASGDEDILQGEISGVAAGKGEITISYEALRPFAASLSGREYEALPLGAKKVSYTLSLSPASLGCPSA